MDSVNSYRTRFGEVQLPADPPEDDGVVMVAGFRVANPPDDPTELAALIGSVGGAVGQRKGRRR